MKRPLSLSFPSWSIDLVRRRMAPTPPSASEPTIVLTTPRDVGEVVAACCTRATEAGVHPGMTFANAHALLAGRHTLHIERADPVHDAAALHALATWALQFSPVTSEDPPDGLLLDGHGLTRLFGSEGAWMRRICLRITELGITVRAAVADTIGCAWALARHAPLPHTIAGAGQEREALAPLPVESLRLEPRALEALFEVGVDRIEHLLEIPRQDLSRRFGEHLLLRLDQALGHAYEIVQPNQLVTPIEVERVFDGPVRQLAAVLRAIEQLCAALADALAARLVAAREIRLTFTRYEAAPLTHTLAFTHPTTDAAHMAHLLTGKTERTCLGGGIEHLHLRASQVAPPTHRQAAIGDGETGVALAEPEHVQQGDRLLGVLFDVLVERCGRGRVVDLEPAPSHIPEHAFRVCEHASRVPGRAGSGADLTAALSPSDRPSVLYARPRQADAIALLPDGAPAWLRWQHEEVRIVRALGPERIGAPWWSGAQPTTRCLSYRDYFKVLDERGRWLWVFRGVESRHWFVHGEWA